MALDLKNIDLKNIDFRNIYEWPKYGRLAVFAVVCAVVFYLGYYLDFSSFSRQIYVRFQQEQDLKQQLKSILKAQAEMKDVVSQFSEIQKLVNQWQGQLVNATTLPDLMNQILKLGTLNRLKFPLFVPGAKKKYEDYFKVPIRMMIQGDYSQIANFISQVANMPQLVAIDDFTISSKPMEEEADKNASADAAGGSGNLMTELTLEVYYLANKK